MDLDISLHNITVDALGNDGKNEVYARDGHLSFDISTDNDLRVRLWFDEVADLEACAQWMLDAASAVRRAPKPEHAQRADFIWVDRG